MFCIWTKITMYRNTSEKKDSLIHPRNIRLASCYSQSPNYLHNRATDYYHIAICPTLKNLANVFRSIAFNCIEASTKNGINKSDMQCFFEGFDDSLLPLSGL